MAPSALQQRRTHNTLLFQKLLNLRDGASPFTLILDSLEQSGGPVVREFARRAKISKSKIIFISYTTLHKKLSFEVDYFITARSKSLSALRTEIISHLPPPPTSAPPPGSTKYLLIIDTLNPLSSTQSPHLSTFLSSLLTSPQISLLATYHTDIPLTTSSAKQAYQPNPLTTLLYLATAVLTISSLNQTLLRKRARDKSLPEPTFGLQEHREGVIFSFQKENMSSRSEVVVEMELRRRSGRGVVEDFVLIPPSSNRNNITTTSTKLSSLSTPILLQDHPLFSTPFHTTSSASETTNISSSTTNTNTTEDDNLTFSLSLTAKQKADRENVVLPYFDAQREGGAAGPGDGGRILYEMGSEDREDFDDEEDEV